MTHDNGFKTDSLGLSKTGRVPYLKYIGFIAIAFMIMMPFASAETVKLVSNTDICEYDDILEKDFCKSVYEVCESGISPDMKKLSFQFDSKKGAQTDKELTYATKEISILKANCKQIEITAWKNPYLDVDNIPCFDGNCWPEYAWWNSSWIDKFNVTVTGNVTSYPLQLNLTKSSMSY